MDRAMAGAGAGAGIDWELPELTLTLKNNCLFTDDYKKIKDQFNNLNLHLEDDGLIEERAPTLKPDSNHVASNNSKVTSNDSYKIWDNSYTHEVSSSASFSNINSALEPKNQKIDMKEDQNYPEKSENSHKYSLVNVKYSGLDDIVGLEDVKKALRQSVIYPIIYPQFFTSGGGSREAWSRALLFGAPGVGKTALVQSLAAEAKLPLYTTSSADLLSAWFGDSEKHIRNMFSQIGSQRCILFIDEIDALCGKRSSNDKSDHTRRMQTELMVQMENYESAGMFLLCATNCPWDIDPAFMRRFQQRIYVTMPNDKARQSLFLKYLRLGSLPKAWPEWSSFLAQTDGLTGSDIRNIVRKALMEPLGELQEATHWQICADGRFVPCSSNVSNAYKNTISKIPRHMVWCRQVTLNDLWCSLRSFSRTVTEETLKPFQQFITDHAVATNR